MGMCSSSSRQVHSPFVLSPQRQMLHQYLNNCFHKIPDIDSPNAFLDRSQNKQIAEELCALINQLRLSPQAFLPLLKKCLQFAHTQEERLCIKQAALELSNLAGEYRESFLLRKVSWRKGLHISANEIKKQKKDQIRQSQEKRSVTRRKGAFQEVREQGVLLGFLQEWIEEGANSAEEIIVRMLIGVGDPSRKARRMLLLNPGVGVFGASVGQHPYSGTLAVLLFAHDFAPHPKSGVENFEAINYFQRVGVGVVELLQLVRNYPSLFRQLIVSHDTQHSFYGQQVLARGRGVEILRDPRAAYQMLDQDLARQEAYIDSLRETDELPKLQYSRQLSQALRLAETKRLEHCEAVSRYGLSLGGMMELPHFWAGTPIELVISLLLEDMEHPQVQEIPGLAVRRRILFSPRYKFCGVRIQPDRNRFFRAKLLLSQGFIPHIHPRFQMLRETHFQRLSANFLAYLNRLRTDIDFFISQGQARLKRFFGTGKSYVGEGALPKQYLEGEEALRELLSQLVDFKKRGHFERLRESKFLSVAANEHCLDMGEHGFLSHQRSNGLTPHQHINKYVRVLGKSEELVHGMTQSLEEELWDLLIADGDSTRKSRYILLRRRQRWAGISFWSHPKYIAAMTLITAQDIDSLPPIDPVIKRESQTSRRVSISSVKMVELEDPSPATPRRFLQYSEKNIFKESDSDDTPIAPPSVRVFSPEKERRSHSLQKMYKC